MSFCLSIVIPSRHRTDLLNLCLSSVIKNAPAGTEIIVIDDGSPDEIVSQSASRFAQVKVIRFPKSRGFCAAANAGIAAARSPIIELLNDDTIVEPLWAEAALAAFADPMVGAVAPLVLQGQPGDDPIIDSIGDNYHLGGFAKKRGHNQFFDDTFQTRTLVHGASGCAAFYRREAIIEVGRFPESFRAYFEDIDLSCRLRRAGFEILFVPESRIWHRGGASHGPLNRRLVQQQSCNEERVFWRNTAGSMRELTQHGAVLAGKAIRRFGEGRLTPWLFGRLLAWTIEGRNRWTSSPIE